MPDDHEPLDLTGSGLDEAHHLAHAGAVEHIHELDTRFGIELFLDERPGLTGAPRGGTKHQAGNMPIVAQPASDTRSVPQPARPERPLVIVDALGPGGLRMPENDELHRPIQARTHTRRRGRLRTARFWRPPPPCGIRPYPRHAGTWSPTRRPTPASGVPCIADCQKARRDSFATGVNR